MSSASSPVHVLLLSIPGLRQEDLSRMPTLQALSGVGDCVPLDPGFPAVTCAVQATLTTGTPPAAHGIVANGLFDRGTHHLEMWISPDGVHRSPRLWDLLKSGAAGAADCRLVSPAVEACDRRSGLSAGTETQS